MTLERRKWRKLARKRLKFANFKEEEEGQVRRRSQLEANINCASPSPVTRSAKVRPKKWLNAAQIVPLLAIAATLVAAQSPKLEEEVELLRETSGARRHRQSHVFKLQTGPINGQLALPRLESALVVESARSPKQLETRSQRLQIPTSGNKSAEACLTPPDEQASVAASSQTLQLTTVERPLARFMSGQTRPSAQWRELDESEPAPNLNQNALKQRFGQIEVPNEVKDSNGGESGSILSLIDDYDSKITTNRTKAQLSCDSGEMILKLNFSEPFKGIVYPDHNRLSACRFFGDGHHNYELRLPLRGCGTRQAAPRVFVNDVIVRFHKALELEEDEVKTLICRYPPPLAPNPLEVVPSNRPPETSADPEQPQFELVEPHRSEEPGNTGNIETLSENLIVAPAGGRQQQESPYQKPALKQLPNQLAESIGIQNNMREPTMSYLDRLSSIELLFLISSLLFLVLLALGLAGSFYCFRRQSGQRASAILRRKRRFAGAFAQAGAAQRATMQQHYAAAAAGRQVAQEVSPPSPESDLSGHAGLLSSAPRRHLAGPQTYMSYKHAYVPDGGHYGGGRHHYPHLAHPSELVLGRRDTAGIYGPHTYQAGRNLRPQREPLLPASEHKQTRSLRFKHPQRMAATNSGRRPNRQQEEPAMHLSRAKSLTSVEPSGSLSRRAIENNYARQHYANHAHLRHSARGRESSSCSSSEGETNGALINNNNYICAEKNLADLLKREKPKIVLKSIEDSFITNFTEIYEQEYTKSDSTRPLDMARWRAAQPPEVAGSSWSSGESDDLPGFPSAQTNLRSLTELDVNFARSSPPAMEAARSLRLVRSAERLSEEGVATSPNWRRTRSNSEPEVRQSIARNAGESFKLAGELNAFATRTADSPSPDLILSPDYDYSRLHLEAPNVESSHNSVSYV